MTQTSNVSRWEQIPEKKDILETAEALKAHGINVIVVENGAQAKDKVLGLIPSGSEVYTMTSTTTEQIGLSNELDESGRYVSIRKQILSVDQPDRRRAARRAAAAAEYAIGSVHAVTMDGSVLAASQSGSQLAVYLSTAAKVIWVVGAHKIVRDLPEAFLRIEQRSFPMEDARMKSVYGSQSSSGLNKLMVINRETIPDRITMVLVKEVLGF